jgi:hypothetical protein
MLVARRGDRKLLLRCRKLLLCGLFLLVVLFLGAAVRRAQQ